MDIFKKAYERGLAEKEQLLSAVPIPCHIRIINRASEFLLINDFNFNATVDQALLLELAELATEDEAIAISTTDESGQMSPSQKKRNERNKKKAKGGGEKNPPGQSENWKIITRQDKRVALSMLLSVDEEDEERGW